MGRRPFKNRVQVSHSSLSNPRYFDPKNRGMGGVTEQNKFKINKKYQKFKRNGVSIIKIQKVLQLM